MTHSEAVQRGINRSNECSWNRKHTLCKFWLRGECQRGQDCSFAHGAAELLTDDDLDDWDRERARRRSALSQVEPYPLSALLPAERKRPKTDSKHPMIADPGASSTDSKHPMIADPGASSGKRKHRFIDTRDPGGGGSLEEEEEEEAEEADVEEEAEAEEADVEDVEDVKDVGDLLELAEPCVQMAVLSYGGPVVWVAPQSFVEFEGNIASGSVIVRCATGEPLDGLFGASFFDHSAEVSADVQTGTGFEEELVGDLDEAVSYENKRDELSGIGLQGACTDLHWLGSSLSVFFCTAWQCGRRLV